MTPQKRREGTAKGSKGSDGARRAPKERWKHEPDAHDYPAAAEFLGMLLTEAQVKATVEALQQAAIVPRLAKDLLRASRLPALPEANFHVAADLAKVRRGERLSPVLLVRGDLSADVPLTIADGYHRICASYLLSEDAPIPCRMVDAPRG